MSAPRFRERLSSLLAGDRGAVAALVVIFFGANWPLLLNRASERVDGESFFAPFYHYLASLARNGHFLRWNPFCSGGSPDFAEPQLGAFSPITLFFALVVGPGPLGFHLYWLCVWLFGGLGAYVLARALTAPPWGALLTALAVVFCGFYIGEGVALSAIYTYSFVPWTLWRVRVAMTTGRLRPAVEAGALWGLSALAGNPVVHIPAAMFVGMVAPAWLPDATRWKHWRTYVLTMVLLAGVGVVVLSPAFGSFRYEVAGYSHRTLPLPRETVLYQQFGWSWFTALATPVFAPLNGMPGWAEFDISLREVYLGAAVPVLATLTAWRQRASWRMWLVLGTGLLFLGTATGSLLPLRAWLYDGVPIMRYFRHAPIFRGFFIFAAAMLAAPATAWIDAAWKQARAAGDRALRPLAVAASAGALLAVGAYVYISLELPDEAAARVSPWAPWHAALAWVGLAVVCLVAVRREGFRRFLPSALTALAGLDMVGAYALTGHIVHQDKPSVVAAGPVGPLTDLGPEGFDRAVVARFNTNLYDNRPVFASYTAMRNFYQEHWGLDRLMRPYVLGPQRVWFAANVPTVPASGDVYEAFAQRAHAIGALPVVRQERADLIHPAASALTPAVRDTLVGAPTAQAVNCQVLAYHDNDLSLRVVCPADGWLLVTDRWSRSWEATVNGQAVPVDGGDFLFRLVPVRAGENIVAMRFRVPWVYALVTLSWSTLAFVAAGAWWAWRRSGKTLLRAPVGPLAAATTAAAVA